METKTKKLSKSKPIPQGEGVNLPPTTAKPKPTSIKK